MTASSTTPSPGRPLRFAAVLEREPLAAWKADAVSQLAACEGVTLVAILLCPSRDRGQGHGFIPRAMDRLARRVVPALAPRVWPDERRSSDLAPIVDGVEALAHLGVDSILDLTQAGAAHELNGVPDAEVWSFVFDGERPDFAPPVFWEACGGGGLASVRLVRNLRDGTSGTLQHGVFGLEPLSLASRVSAIFDAIAAWPATAARAMRIGGVGAPPADLPVAPAAVGYWSFPAFGFRLARAILHKLLYVEVWNVGLTRTPLQEVVRGHLGSPQWLPERAPAGPFSPRCFIADPFLVSRGGDTHCLFEDLDYSRNRGSIGAISVASSPPDAFEPKAMFEDATHWSYPYVFEEGGIPYCIPENADRRGAILYRIDGESPAPLGDLLPGLPALDPSLVAHGGRYWIFCTMREGPFLNTTLHVFYSDRLLGPYRPHPLNPVKTDVRSARPAGTLFRSGDFLYRPAQNCAGGYGRALAINRIVELTPTRFVEELAAMIEPDPASPYPDGLHTLSACGELIAVDGKRYAFSPLSVIGKLRSPIGANALADERA